MAGIRVVEAHVRKIYALKARHEVVLIYVRGLIQAEKPIDRRQISNRFDDNPGEHQRIAD
jgi:hypothetical protein